MNRFAAGSAVFAAVTFSRLSPALAMPREVLVVASTNRCIDADSLAWAIHRDTSLPVRVVKREGVEERSHESSDDASHHVVVEVKGQGQELTVDLRGADLQVSQPLRASACETASDVAAAFVVSLLAPPPAVVVPPAPEPPALDVQAPVTVPPEKDELVAERAALMVDDLDTEVRMRRATPTILRVIAASAGAAGSALWFYRAANSQETGPYLQGAGTAVWTIGAISTFAAPDDYMQTIMMSSWLVGAGLITLGQGVDWREGGSSPYAIGGISSALFLEGTLIFAGGLIRRPVSGATLAADYELIRSPERRSALTADQLARIEADFRRSASPLPRWLLAAPLLAGGSLAVGAAYADTQSSDLHRTLDGLVGGGLLAIGALTLFPLVGYGRYERLLPRNGVQPSVQAAPGKGIGVHLHGSF